MEGWYTNPSWVPPVCRRGPESDSLVDPLVHDVHRSLMHQRTDDRSRVERVSRRQALGPGDELLKEFVVDTALG